MNAHPSLIAELENAVQCGSKEMRVETLRKLTDLFLETNDQLNEEQIEVFDEVLGHLVTRIETRALIALSGRLAPVNKAPHNVIHCLARNDEIAVAGPVLSMSDRLTTRDLIDIAATKSQSHLLAISKRNVLEEALTDTLLERGDRQVVSSLAGNKGARFSAEGFERLVTHAERDQSLIETLGLRFDLPLHIFRELLVRATETVRTRLLALAKPEQLEEISGVVTTISAQAYSDANAPQDWTKAHQLVQFMQERGELNDIAVLEFAQAGRYPETVTALAVLSSAPVVMIQDMLKSARTEALLIPCKAAGISWLGLKALLQLFRNGRNMSEDDLKKVKHDYLRLSRATAQRVLRFWSAEQTVRKSASA
jgi:uncharacterized protein (DUF2336 family)